MSFASPEYSYTHFVMVIHLKHTSDPRDGLLVLSQCAGGVQVVQGLGIARVTVGAGVVLPSSSSEGQEG